jgi:hypothetical protein
VEDASPPRRMPTGSVLMYEILLFTFHTLGVFALGVWFGRLPRG